MEENYKEQVSSLKSLVHLIGTLTEIQYSKNFYQILINLIINEFNLKYCTVIRIINREPVVVASNKHKVNSVIKISNMNNKVDLIIDGNTIGYISFLKGHKDNTYDLMKILAYNVSLLIRNRELYRELNNSANIDPLTGCYNRRYLFQRINNSFKDELGYAVFMLDIDHFKNVNDTYGHVAGDRVLCEICNKIKSHIRKDDMLFRYGGEEFLLFLYGIHNKKIAFEQGERIRALIENMKINHCFKTINVTISIGVSVHGIDSLDFQKLLEVADKRLYSSKQLGRNQVTI